MEEGHSGTFKSQHFSQVTEEQEAKASKGSGRYIPSWQDPCVSGTWWESSHLLEGWGVPIVHCNELWVGGSITSVSLSTPD